MCTVVQGDRPRGTPLSGEVNTRAVAEYSDDRQRLEAIIRRGKRTVFRRAPDGRH